MIALGRPAIVAAFAAVTVATAPCAPAWASQDPARDATRRPAASAGIRLTGLVHVDDADRTPIGGAKVTMAPGLLSAPISTVTGADGRFEFPAVAPGNYTLVVLRGGYVTTYYGARTPGRGPGVPIGVVEGRPVPEIVVAMARGAAISGVVRSELGRPIANVMVQIAGDSQAGGLPTVPGVIPIASTDDRGAFRIYGLAPGSYRLSARADILQSMSSARPVTAEEIRWADDIARAAATGAPAPMPDPPPVPPPVVRPPAFYPSAPDAARATPIVLAAGEERGDIEIVLPLVPTAVVRGAVFGDDGAPAPGVVVQVEAARPVDTLDAMLPVAMRSTRTDPAGAFVIQGVPPGDYRITARLAEPARPQAQPPSGMAGLAAMAMIGMTGSTGGPAGWYASEPVFVQGRDVDGVAMRLARAPAVTARVVYADPAPEPAPAAPVFMLMALSTGTTQADVANALRSSSLFVANEDGTFTARGVLPGRYVVSAFDMARLVGPAMAGQIPGAPANAWSLVSAVTGGRDIADEPLEIAGGPGISDLVVTFTNRPTEISGTVIDRADRPTGAFPIVVFSTNRAHWTPGARRTQLVRPSTNGTYRAVGLPPGEYYVAAVTEVEDRSLGDPAFLELLVPGAFTIALGPGEHKVQDLRLGGG